MTKNKIAIVGTAPSKDEAPFYDKDWEIWTFNRTGFDLPRWDVLFEIHRRFADNPTDEIYLKRLADAKLGDRTVYTLDPLFPGATVIDRDALHKNHRPIWLSSSITYAFAMAIDRKPEEIGLWGIEMESREEYVVQFAGCVHFMDICKERGIKVTLPDGCLLARNPNPYPDRFETLFAVTLEKKAQRVQRLIDKWDWRLEQAKVRAYGLIGRMQCLEELEEWDKYETAKKESEHWQQYAHETAKGIQRLKGELMALQQMKRLFVWNILPPELGDEREAETEDPGPV